MHFSKAGKKDLCRAPCGVTWIIAVIMDLIYQAPTTTCQTWCWALYACFSLTELDLACITHIHAKIWKDSIILPVQNRYYQRWSLVNCVGWLKRRCLISVRKAWLLLTSCKRKAFFWLAATTTFRPSSPQRLISKPQNFRKTLLYRLLYSMELATSSVLFRDQVSRSPHFLLPLRFYTQTILEMSDDRNLDQN